MGNYVNINAWRLADDLTVSVCKKTRNLPTEERSGLTSQLRRAAYSVPANIVEGSAGESKKDYLRFLSIARASLAETQYLIPLARRLGYLAENDATDLEGQTKRVVACLHGLVQAVTREVNASSREGISGHVVSQSRRPEVQ